LGRIIGLLGVVDGRSANRVNRDWHAIYTQPHEQKERVKRYFPARELRANDADFESIIRTESEELLKKVFGIIQSGNDWQINMLLQSLNTELIKPHLAAALAGEVSHVEGLDKAENDFIYVLAASHGYIDVTQLDKKQRKLSACIAAVFGCTKVIEDIAEIEGVDTTEPVLIQAARYGHLDIAKLLLAKFGEAIFKSGEQAVFMAAQYGHHAIVEYLYPLVASVLSAKDKGQMLIVAARNGHLSSVEYLYPQMANVISDDDKSRALGLAAQNGHPYCCRIFISTGRKCYVS
jgi:hypothetical protein